MVRRFEAWKSEVIKFLSGIDAEGEMARQRDYVILVLRSLRPSMLHRGLWHLDAFLRYWRVQYPAGTMPSKEEIVAWLSDVE